MAEHKLQDLLHTHHLRFCTVDTVPSKASATGAVDKSILRHSLPGYKENIMDQSAPINRMVYDTFFVSGGRMMMTTKQIPVAV